MCPSGGVMGFQCFSDTPNPVFRRYRNGGLAEYVVAPYWLIDVLPSNVSFEVGAKVHTVATAVSVLRRAELKAGSVVLVTAATGAAGVSILKVARFFGVKRLILIGRSITNLKAVEKFSSVPCDLVALDQLDSDWTKTGKLVRRIRQLCPAGVDSFLDLTPSGQDLWQALGALKVNGTMVHLGGNISPLGVPMVALMAQFWRITGVRFHPRNDARDILKWLAEDQMKLEDLISHRYSFDEVSQAVEQLTSRSEAPLLIVVNFENSQSVALFH